jgi:hypothetical protein
MAWIRKREHKLTRGSGAAKLNEEDMNSRILFRLVVSAFSRLKAAMPEQVRRILEKYEANEDYDNVKYKQAAEELYRKHVFRGGKYSPTLRLQ